MGSNIIKDNVGDWTKKLQFYTKELLNGKTTKIRPGPDETEEINEDESVVHHYASVGYVEVLFKVNFLLLLGA